ncbi:MAG: glycosyltransferase, partial [Thermoanaerobaculia bacterium]|nr:glycosyltransferase [Thermoanaerobaculia bacterium]
MSAGRARERSRIAIVGPVFPYRAGIAYCTTRLGEELSRSHEVDIASFRRQYPKRFYPGRNDVDTSLEARRPSGARFQLDILHPWTWLAEGWRIRKRHPDAVILVWWIWVWALPYLVLLALLPRNSRIVLQCHNITDKEPAGWKSWLTNLVLRRGDVLVVHAASEAEEARRRIGHHTTIVETFLPVHELGGEMPDREVAKRQYGLEGKDVALFFGHVRPFKGLDVALEAVGKSERDWILFVAGEVWWDEEQIY